MQSLQIFTKGGWNIRTHVSNEIAYFNGRDIAKSLGYSNHQKAIRDHVFEEDRSKLQDIRGERGGPPIKNEQGHTVYITEPGVYAMIFGSQKEEAKAFKRWVCQEVLPRLRKSYQEQMILCLKSETDLHYKIIKAIRRFYPHALMMAGLGELQDTPEKRLDSYRKGYQAGSPDIMILNQHKTYNGLAIELKNPKGKGTLSSKQFACLENYRLSGFKTLCSDDYDNVLLELFDYFQDTRLSCPHCCKKFKTKQTLDRHMMYFHQRGSK